MPVFIEVKNSIAFAILIEDMIVHKVLVLSRFYFLGMFYVKKSGWGC